MLLPDEVSGIVYLQHGFNTRRAGTPNVYFVDTISDFAW